MVIQGSTGTPNRYMEGGPGLPFFGFCVTKIHKRDTSMDVGYTSMDTPIDITMDISMDIVMIARLQDTAAKAWYGSIMHAIFYTIQKLDSSGVIG